MKRTKQVIFKVGDESYGFDILLVNAIEDYEGVVPIPNASENIMGIINLRGEIVPVFSLRKKFGMAEIPVDEKTQLIVTKSDDILIGFKVDSVEQIFEFEGEDLHPVPFIVKEASTTYANCVASRDNRLIILINLDGVISKAERQIAEEIIESNTQDSV